jgi:hypothetical protein
MASAASFNGNVYPLPMGCPALLHRASTLGPNVSLSRASRPVARSTTRATTANLYVECSMAAKRCCGRVEIDREVQKLRVIRALSHGSSWKNGRKTAISRLSTTHEEWPNRPTTVRLRRSAPAPQFLPFVLQPCRFQSELAPGRKSFGTNSRSEASATARLIWNRMMSGGTGFWYSRNDESRI